jgi:hypothetical protein
MYLAFVGVKIYMQYGRKQCCDRKNIAAVWIKYMCYVKYLMIGCNSHSYVAWIKTNKSHHFIDVFNVVFVALGIRASRWP